MWYLRIGINYHNIIHFLKTGSNFMGDVQCKDILIYLKCISFFVDISRKSCG